MSEDNSRKLRITVAALTVICIATYLSGFLSDTQHKRNRESPMTEITHEKMNENNPTKLRMTVAALAVIYVMTFLGGFLQATPYNFVNYIFFFLLFIGGFVLMSGTVHSTQTGTAKGFLFLSGISTTLLFIFGFGYEWFRLKGNQDLEASIEGFLYLLTLFFWIGVFGSLALIRGRS
jgi:hypothetical protein